MVEPDQENYISSSVIDDSNNALEEAYVYAWTNDGLEASSYTNANGDFNITVASGNVWNVGSEYIQ